MTRSVHHSCQCKTRPEKRTSIDQTSRLDRPESSTWLDGFGSDKERGWGGASLQSSHNNTSRRGGGQTSRAQSLEGPGNTAELPGLGRQRTAMGTVQWMEMGRWAGTFTWENVVTCEGGIMANGRPLWVRSDGQGCAGACGRGVFFSVGARERDKTRHSNDPVGKHSLTIHRHLRDPWEQRTRASTCRG